MIKKMNKPKKEKKNKLESNETTLIINEWAKGRSVSEIHMSHHLALELVKPIHDQCDEVQNEITRLMGLELPKNENELKLLVSEQFEGADHIVEMIIQYSDINNNGNWDMFKNYNWGE